jgi:inhibitor of KinA
LPAKDFRTYPLAENAVCVDFGNRIDEALNRRVLALADALAAAPFAGFEDVVPAYSSLAVFFQPKVVRQCQPQSPSAGHFVMQWLTERIGVSGNFEQISDRPVVQIPVCYDLGLDWEAVCRHTQLSRSEVIGLHTAPDYRVFMMGFLPGFAYLGGLDTRLAVPRLAQPRTKVAAGSVGLAGSQTGVYPLDSPGGWQIIGRTPLRLFDPHASPLTLLQAGDTVRFYQISAAELYQNRDSQN